MKTNNRHSSAVYFAESLFSKLDFDSMRKVKEQPLGEQQFQLARFFRKMPFILFKEFSRSDRNFLSPPLFSSI
jgi:hypothetical protein